MDIKDTMEYKLGRVIRFIFEPPIILFKSIISHKSNYKPDFKDSK